MSAAPAWDPRGFERYGAHYPATPPIEALACVDATPRFIGSWDRLAEGAAAGPALQRRARDTTFVLVRGLFGSWIPRNFIAPLQALRRTGARAMLARSGSVATVEDNARRIARDVQARVPSSHRLVFLCHSKGGLDALEMLRRLPGLRQRTGAVVLCQTPRAGCPILESVFLGAHADSLAGAWERSRECVARIGLDAAGARAGCLEVTGARLQATIERLDGERFTMPVISVASWSIAATAWLDSQHARMRAVRPGCAHDGLFFTQSLVWPIGRQVLLPRMDHSQPTVGGARLDHARLWMALADMALDEAA